MKKIILKRERISIKGNAKDSNMREANLFPTKMVEGPSAAPIIPMAADSQRENPIKKNKKLIRARMEKVRKIEIMKRKEYFRF